MIWDKEHECMSRSKLEALQLERLQRSINRVYDKVKPYRAKMDAIGVKPSHIKTLKDISKLPLTTKDDLRANYPFGMFAVPKRDIVRLHASSGTTGNPTVVAYTQNDMNMWTDLVARMASLASVTKYDTAQICFSYGLFTGAHGLHYGIEKIGGSVIPVGGGSTEKQLKLMHDFGTTALIATPSYALYLAEVAEKLGIDMSKSSLRVGLFGGEPWTDEMRREIESRLHILATDNYGMSELLGPGVAGECEFATGLHIAEDHFIVETIDPDTLEVLPPGSIGELVYTSLTKEAFPIVRYRTKDISRIIEDQCICGRTTARMERIKGRTDDMLIIRGVNVFPSQIESVIMTVPGIGPEYQINVFRKGYLDDLEVVVELRDGSVLEKYSELKLLEKTVIEKMRSVLSINVKVKLVEPNTFERTQGKAKRLNDLRNNK